MGLKRSEILEEFPLVKEYTYLSTSGVGLTPVSVTKDLNAFNEERTRIPPYEELFGKWLRMVEETRKDFARYINASPDEVSFQENSSMGINTVVEMLPWKSGDKVIMDDLHFPSDVYPFQKLRKKGVETVILKNRRGGVDVSDYEKAIDDRTRLITISYISWLNGFRYDVEALGSLAEEKGIYFLVDATHGTGYMDIDVKKWKTSFLVSSNYKWLLAPFGAGELYIEKKVADELEPPHVGWYSVGESVESRPSKAMGPGPYRLAPGGRRFEPGNLSYFSVYGLNRCLSFLQKLGPSEIRRVTFRLRDRLLEGLQEIGAKILNPLDEKHLSAMFFCAFDKIDGAELAGRLEKLRIIVPARNFGESSGLRVSPYFYNSDEDVDRFIEKVRGLLR
jgi:cysteine desulfurase/selenocysteine lyase